MPLKFRTLASIALVTLMLSDAAKLSAAECTVENIALTTQEEVNNFQVTYGGGGTCDTVTGNLTIEGNDIVDFSPLQDITAVGSELLIAGLSFTTLEGLENLTTVGDLWIRTTFHGQRGPPLTNLDGLSGLTSVSGSISLGGLFKLQNVDGLSGITGEVGTIRIRDVFLSDFDGLSGITHVREDLELIGVGNVDGLANVTSVGGRLWARAANVNGLASVESVGSDLIIEGDNLDDCTALRTLLDDVDDAEPGPGPGTAGIPDVGGDVILAGDVGCSAIPEIFIDPVSGFTASDGVYPDKVRVEWIGNGRETHFRLEGCWNSGCMGVGDYFYVELGADISQYDDMTARVYGNIVYYRLRACVDEYCSGYVFDQGHRLGYPNSFSATDGEYLDKVRLSWSDTIGATYVEVYLCFTNLESSCGIPIKTLPAGTQTYDDTLATADGTVYYYRLKACNENGCGIFGPANAGSRFSKPKDVSATDAFFEDRVRVSWSDVIGETWYEVYRCVDEQISSCGLPIANPAADATAYDDLEAAADGRVYYYRLKACNANGCTEYTDADPGSRFSPEIIFNDGFEG